MTANLIGLKSLACQVLVLFNFLWECLMCCLCQVGIPGVSVNELLIIIPSPKKD